MIRQINGIQITTDLGRYLGVPLINKKVNKSTYQFIVDKVQQRLSGWKAKFLNLTGRATHTAIPNYVMQTALLPKSTCNSLNKINRSCCGEVLKRSVKFIM